MNPKMDRGLLQEEGLFIEEFRNDYLCRMPYALELVHDDAPVALTCAAMDALFGLEATWYTGRAAFPETVLTSMLVQRPEYIQNEPLRVYVLATLRACQMVEALVRQGGVCGTEEFYQSTFGTLPEPEDLENDELSPRVLIERLGECIGGYLEYPALCYRLERLLLWLRLLSFVYCAAPLDSLEALLDDLSEAALALLPAEGDERLDEDPLFRREYLAIFPSLANYYLAGCPRVCGGLLLQRADAVTHFANMVLGLRILGRLLREDGLRVPELVRDLWHLEWHPVVSSALHFMLFHAGPLQLTPRVIEASAAHWLRLPPHTRVNVAPITDVAPAGVRLWLTCIVHPGHCADQLPLGLPEARPVAQGPPPHGQPPGGPRGQQGALRLRPSPVVALCLRAPPRAPGAAAGGVRGLRVARVLLGPVQAACGGGGRPEGRLCPLCRAAPGSGQRGRAAVCVPGLPVPAALAGRARARGRPGGL